MFGNNKSHKNDNRSNYAPLTSNDTAKRKSRWSIVSGYISSAISAGQDVYGVPVVNFKVIIPLKHPTPIHYEYYAIAGGRRVPEIQTEMIDHWDYQCSKYSSDPIREVKRLQSERGTLVEVMGHRSEGTFKVKKDGFSIKHSRRDNDVTANRIDTKEK